MHDIFRILLHVIVTLIRLVQPGGLRSVVVESVLVRHQLLILNRRRRRAPNLRVAIAWAGFWFLLLKPTRLARAAIVLKPATLINFRRALVRGK